MTASATTSWTVQEAVAYLPELPLLDYGDKKVRQKVWRCLQALGLHLAANVRQDQLRQEGMHLIDARKQAAIQVAQEWEQSQRHRSPSDACNAPHPPQRVDDEEVEAVQRLRGAVKSDNAPMAKNTAWVSANLPPKIKGKRPSIEWDAIDPKSVPSREAITMLTFAYGDEDTYRKYYDAKRMPAQASTELKAAFTDTETPAAELHARLQKAKGGGC